MEPKFNLVESLVGNLNVSPKFDISRHLKASPGANSKLKQSTQVNQLVFNIYGADGKLIQETIDLDSLTSDKSDSQDSGYSAIFLDNDQVYFGKLGQIRANSKFVKLRDIFYLKSEQAVVEDDQANINLVKLGQELHGPTDEMNINVDKIVFWEKLKDDSPVVTTIHSFYKST